MQSMKYFRPLMLVGVAALASCGKSSKPAPNNESQFDEMDYALAAEYSALPAAVVIRVPLDASGKEIADDASMRAYRGRMALTQQTDLATLYSDGTSPGSMISSIDELSEEGTSTQSWGYWNDQYQGPGQGPAQGPAQGPFQGKVVQAPIQTPMKGKVVQAPVQGKVVQAPFQGKVVQAPVQGKVVQAPFQGKVAQTPMQGPMQGPMQAPVQKGCCLAKHDKSKPFFDLFHSRKPRCGILSPVLKPRRCMAVPMERVPVVAGPVIGSAPVVVEQQPVVLPPPAFDNAPVVQPGPAPMSYAHGLFTRFQPRAYSNVNDNGFWGYEAPVSATYGQNRYYAYPRPACVGAEWCALVNDNVNE
jgi:hypothetical protein